MTLLSGYRIMWMMVMFDLPVGTSTEQKAAGDFRNDLLDLGFEMAQYSIYLRCCSGRPQCDVYVGKVKDKLPAGGKVYIHFFTDKQYEQIIRFENRKRRDAGQKPQQFEMF
jgi:CRISPR-associated protein Cas2